MRIGYNPHVCGQCRLCMEQKTTAHPWAYALYSSLLARYTAHPWAYLIFCSCKNKIRPTWMWEMSFLYETKNDRPSLGIPYFLLLQKEDTTYMDVGNVIFVWNKKRPPIPGHTLFFAPAKIRYSPSLGIKKPQYNCGFLFKNLNQLSIRSFRLGSHHHVLPCAWQ